MLSPADGQALCRYARAAIAAALGGQPAVPPPGPAYQYDAACFVTLYRGDKLHGCIGSLEAHRPLLEDVADNAVSAALRDPRNTPLTRLPVHSRAEAIAALRPGIDGVVLRYQGRRGTFLPQVWSELPNPHEFWQQLLRKAGLPADFDRPELHVYRYTVEKWIEEPSRP